jgi:hypothetical protein|tara:strand:- start:93 stop:290 length:198 start_codon:yes stop_codon:yes gene_type:complete
MVLSETVKDMAKTLIKFKLTRKNETLNNIVDWVDDYINVEYEYYEVCLDCGEADSANSCCYEEGI